MTVGLIIDIIIGVALLASIIVGAVRGLFKTVIALIITVAAIIGSIWLSGILVKPATTIIYPMVSDKLERLVTEPTLHINLGAILSNTTEKKINEFLELEIKDDFFSSGIPEEILNIAKGFGFDEDSLRGPTEKALKSAQDVLKKYMDTQTAGNMNEAGAKEATENAVEEAGKAYLQPLVRAGLIIILYILITALLKVLESVLDEKIKDTRGVKQVNALGGAVLSFAISAVVIFLLIYLCVKFGITTIYSEQIQGSYVLPFIMRFILKTPK